MFVLMAMLGWVPPIHLLALMLHPLTRLPRLLKAPEQRPLQLPLQKKQKQLAPVGPPVVLTVCKFGSYTGFVGKLTCPL